ncbi:MAG TPA: hypothetical protein VM695_13340 [Phycisphaerae bacterium]|nr:hypothetical protein [Phycisphaerae bacterium]
MNHLLRVLAVGIAVGLSARIASSADDVNLAVDRITKGTTDPTERAKKLLHAAKTLELEAGLIAGLLETAVDCAVQGIENPDAFQVGIDAIDLLQENAPAKRAQWTQKRLQLCNLAYQRAPEESKPAAAVALMEMLGDQADRAARAGQWEEATALYAEASRLAGLTARRRLEFDRKHRQAEFRRQTFKRIASIEAIAAQRPEDTRIRQQLLEQYAIHLDDLAKAAKYLTPEAPQSWQTYLPMARKGMSGLPEAVVGELCNWYEKYLAPKAPPEAREAMLRRARAYARRAVEMHPAKDLALMDAQERLQRIDRQLEEFGPVGSMLKRLRHVDLLELVDLAEDASEGNWQMRKGVFCSTAKLSGTLRLPVRATGSYGLLVTVAKTQEAGDIYVTFPVEDHEVQLTLHEYYAPSSPMSFDNVTWMTLKLDKIAKQASSSQSRIITPTYQTRKVTAFAIDIGVRIQGKQVQIAVAMNRQKWLSWAGTTDSLTDKKRISGTPFSVQYKSPSVLLSSAKLRPMGGEVEYVRSPDEQGKAR